jgi:hypothetical protein
MNSSASMKASHLKKFEMQQVQMAQQWRQGRA